MTKTLMSPAEIRSAIQDNPKTRPRDLADKLGTREAQLVAAQVGPGITRIEAHPNQLIPTIKGLGEVMALTRNDSCVHEKVGIYDNYHGGAHATMVVNEEIDLRMFPSHWLHCFMIENETDKGMRRSIQVFDAAGDAVHKIHLRKTSDLAGWDKIKKELATGDMSDSLTPNPRIPPEVAKSRPDKLDVLRKEWDRLTDTHQFLRLCAKLRMNRLGAYRIAGAPFVRPLASSAVDQMLHAVRDREIEFIYFVGNRGCIQIHSGPIKRLKTFGPWQNILDPGFDMHLRLDHVAEVWAVEKPTRRGPALSIEAFDADGSLIFQAFPMARDDRDFRPEWRAIIDALEPLSEKVAG